MQMRNKHIILLQNSVNIKTNGELKFKTFKKSVTSNH